MKIFFIILFLFNNAQSFAGTIGDINNDNLINTTEAVYALKVTADMENQLTLNVPYGHSLDAEDGSPTDSIYIDKNGNVGIGTKNPSANLSINAGGIENFTKHLSGLATIPQGYTLIIGVGTSFKEELEVGDSILINNEIVSVKSIISPTQLVLSLPHKNGANSSNIFTTNDIVNIKSVSEQEAVVVNKSGNVGIGTTNPSVKLDVKGNIIRTIPYSTGLGPIDDTDVGQIKSRILKVEKKKDDTVIRIGYTDNLRTYHVTSGSDALCRWEIRIDGVSCPGGKLVYDYYTQGNNTPRSRHVIGYCEGVSSGEHEIQVWVGDIPGITKGDCKTGWNNSRWVLEAEEVYKYNTNN